MLKLILISIIISSIIGVTKPHEIMYKIAIDELNVTPDSQYLQKFSFFIIPQFLIIRKLRLSYISMFYLPHLNNATEKFSPAPGDAINTLSCIKFAILFANHTIPITIIHILIQPVTFFDRHLIPSCFCFSYRHLTIMIFIYRIKVFVFICSR